jgi:hypothetical protein
MRRALLEKKLKTETLKAEMLTGSPSEEEAAN